MISVIVPTIQGREHWFERCEQAYRATTEDMEFIVLNDYPTCGKAWNVGIEKAKGDYLHLSADDLEPHPGWWQAALSTLSRGALPCPRILNPDGTLQSCGFEAKEVASGTRCEVARVPFFPLSLVETLYPIFENHYLGDYWITWKALRAGWPTVVERKYLFTHHLASEGRLGSFDEDLAAYKKAVL